MGSIGQSEGTSWTSSRQRKICAGLPFCTSLFCSCSLIIYTVVATWPGPRAISGSRRETPYQKLPCTDLCKVFASKMLIYINQTPCRLVLCASTESLICNHLVYSVWLRYYGETVTQSLFISISKTLDTAKSE